MPPHKAAKKAAQKAAHDLHKKHHHTKDLRRAYEHLGRVEILGLMQSGSCEEVISLVNLAQDEMENGGSRNAADLLRAAEHLSFAALLDRAGSNTQVYGVLMPAISDELDRLADKAQEHWQSDDADEGIAQIYRDSLTRAGAARNQGLFRQALELVRAAEALAHVKPPHRKHAPKRVAARSNVRELAAS